jgi:cell wall-associated NlpC family hydrolase
MHKKAKNIIQLAKSKLGRRYVWGATGSNAFDCSGLTTYVCKKNGIKLPRRAIAQSKVGKYVPRSKLKPGDLIFFDTSKRRKGYVNHVGIYIGNGKFIHASSAKHKVTITNLNKPFYSQRFKVARRVIN